MSEIKRNTDWNAGGGKWIEIVPAALVASYSRASDTAAPDITLLPGTEWTLIYTAQETLQYTESADKTDNGDLYSIEVKGFSPADSLEKRTALERLFRYGRMLVRFRDNARQTRLAGSKIEPLELTYTLATDSAVSGNRGYNLTLKGTSTSPCAYED